jgi:hypothetical protein
MASLSISTSLLIGQQPSIQHFQHFEKLVLTDPALQLVYVILIMNNVPVKAFKLANTAPVRGGHGILCALIILIQIAQNKSCTPHPGQVVNTMHQQACM